jgi:hypothetical protein
MIFGNINKLKKNKKLRTEKNNFVLHNDNMVYNEYILSNISDDNLQIYKLFGGEYVLLERVIQMMINQKYDTKYSDIKSYIITNKILQDLGSAMELVLIKLVSYLKCRDEVEKIRINLEYNIVLQEFNILFYNMIINDLVYQILLYRNDTKYDEYLIVVKNEINIMKDILKESEENLDIHTSILELYDIS